MRVAMSNFINEWGNINLMIHSQFLKCSLHHIFMVARFPVICVKIGTLCISNHHATISTVNLQWQNQISLYCLCTFGT